MNGQQQDAKNNAEL